MTAFIPSSFLIKKNFASSFGTLYQRLSLQATVPRTPDLSQAQASVQAASKSAGAYLSSWGAWAAEKRKTGWGRSISSSAKLGNSSNSNSTMTATTNTAKIDRNSNSRNRITTITTDGDIATTAAAAAAGATTSNITTTNNSENLTNSLNLLSSEIKKSSSSSNGNGTASTVTTSAVNNVKSAPPTPISEKLPAPLQRQLHEPRASESVKIENRVGLKEDMDMERSEKVPIAMTVLERKEIGQGPDRGAKGEGNKEDVVPVTNYTEITEETEVLFSGQEEEDSSVTDIGGDVNSAKKQQLSGNDTTNVIDVSDANNSQGSEPIEKVGKTIGGGEGKGEVL